MVANAFPAVQKNKTIDDTNDKEKTEAKVETSVSQDPLATGLADWDLLPPQVVIRHARRKKDVL